MNIPLNAFSSITINGLVFKADASHPQTFQRGLVKAGVQHWAIKFNFGPSLLYLVRPEGIPPRPLSRLPPPGDRHITLSLGEQLGSGRVGSVHAVNIVEPDLSIQLQKLVVKISFRKRSASLAQEAWFYEELEQLQGVSIAQCYGFFQTRLSDDQRIVLMSKQGRNADKYDEDSTFGPADEEYEAQLPGQGRLISILIMERLGNNIPVGVPVDDIKQDVIELFHDLARHGVEYMDIRWSNILSTLDDSNSNAGSSSVVCPCHGHIHQWRIIDLDQCRKTDLTPHQLGVCNGQWLDRLFDNLVDGNIIEPWD